MSALLPILHPAMALCGICPEPGHCCKDFILEGAIGVITFWADSWREDAEQYLRENNLPYRVHRAEGSYWTASFQEFTRVRFSCEHLSNGRCGIYERRPEICRKFLPGSSTLCVFGVAAA